MSGNHQNYYVSVFAEGFYKTGVRTHLSAKCYFYYCFHITWFRIEQQFNLHVMLKSLLWSLKSGTFSIKSNLLGLSLRLPDSSSSVHHSSRWSCRRKWSQAWLELRVHCSFNATSWLFLHCNYIILPFMQEWSLGTNGYSHV